MTLTEVNTWTEIRTPPRPGCQDENADAEGEGEEDAEVPGGPGQGLPYRRTGHPLSRLVYAPKAVRWTEGMGGLSPIEPSNSLGGVDGWQEAKGWLPNKVTLPQTK